MTMTRATYENDMDDAGKFNWRRITRHPRFMEYRRLAAAVALVNLGVFYWGIQTGWLIENGAPNLAAFADMALYNFTVGILIRQQRIINFLFWLATRIPTSWPLWMRWGAGKVYHFGGLHSGANVAGSLWFSGLLAALMITPDIPLHLLVVSGGIVGALALIIATAIGPMRARYHDVFERVHRFVGWGVLVLFWVQAAQFSQHQGVDFIGSQSFWLLMILTASIVSPWLTTKRVKVDATKLSDHAVSLKFAHGDDAFPGSANAVSHSLFGEYHSFATVTTPGQDGFRQIVSRAGDWTGALIDAPPEHLWIRGITTSGVARIEVLFKKVVYVATGSGIGPVLPHILAHDVPNKVIWATRNPNKTYGTALVAEIIANTENPMIWDTDSHGKPDLSKLALQAVRETGAEAVIIISNQKLTRQVVYDCEAAGIPAYGAIWDS